MSWIHNGSLEDLGGFLVTEVDFSYLLFFILYLILHLV